METLTLETKDREILSRAVDNIDDVTLRQMAQGVLKMALPKADADRVRQLTEKNRKEILTPAERRELESYIRVGDVMSLLKARALRTLGKADAD